MEQLVVKNRKNNPDQFWSGFFVWFKLRQDNKPIELFSNEVFDQKLQYIHMNPVESGIVENPEDYLYSSARDYAGIKGLLDVKFLD